VGESYRKITILKRKMQIKFIEWWRDCIYIYYIVSTECILGQLYLFYRMNSGAIISFLPNKFGSYYIGRSDGAFWIYSFFLPNKFGSYYIGRSDGTFWIYSFFYRINSVAITSVAPMELFGLLIFQCQRHDRFNSPRIYSGENKYKFHKSMPAAWTI
jgi:hypothetical protein